MAVRNYNMGGTTPIVVQHMNTREQAPLLQVKSWINKHTADILDVSCVGYKCTSACALASCKLPLLTFVP
jgi:hypothetical protein